MPSQKINSYIGFSVKAGDVEFGLDNILTSRRRVHLVVTDETLGDASKRKLGNYLESKNVPVVTLEGELLGRDVLKRDKCKIIGILNKSLASAIIAEANKK